MQDESLDTVDMSLSHMEWTPTYHSGRTATLGAGRVWNMLGLAPELVTNLIPLGFSLSMIYQVFFLECMAHKKSSPCSMSISKCYHSFLQFVFNLNGTSKHFNWFSFDCQNGSGFFFCQFRRLWPQLWNLGFCIDSGSRHKETKKELEVLLLVWRNVK